MNKWIKNMNSLSEKEKNEIIEWAISFLNDAYVFVGKVDGNKLNCKQQNCKKLINLVNRGLPDGLVINSNNMVVIKK